MKFHDQPYLQLVNEVLEKGTRKTNRTGVDTISIFGYQMRFDLRDGSIPLLTTKKMHIPSIIHEILWYLTGNTSINYLEKNNVRIWREWADKQGELGPVYGQMWRSWNNPLDVTDIVFITPKIKVRNSDQITDISKISYLGDYDQSDPYLKQLQRLWYEILDKCYNINSPQYKLYGEKGIFVDDSWLCFATFQKDVKTIPNWIHKRLHWQQYELSIDYFASNVYSKQTCAWIHKTHNVLYKSKNIKPFEVIDIRSKRRYTFLSITEAVRRLGIRSSACYKVLQGKQKSAQGYTMKYIDIPTNTVPRYDMPIDQIKSLISKLKINPYDRRLIVNSWNPSVLPENNKTFDENVANGRQALPPCHYVFQCYVRPLSLQERLNLQDQKLSINFDILNESSYDVQKLFEKSLDQQNIPKYELSLLLNQRSCDVGLGVPFNIVQYSILLRMIAHVVNMTPGDFIWNGGDIHIYTNHIESLKEQLTRAPFPSPRLILNPNVKNIDDFKFEDFDIVDYQYHPTIKMSVAV